MSFLCLSSLAINVAHIVCIQSDDTNYTIQTSRTYRASCDGPPAMNYSYPEHFIFPKESADGHTIRSWVACHANQVWPNAVKMKKAQAQHSQAQHLEQEEPKRKEREPYVPPKQRKEQAAKEARERAQKDEEAQKAEEALKAQEDREEEELLREAIAPRHVSVALRRLNENIRRDSPSGSRSASPFKGLTSPPGTGLKAIGPHLTK